MDLSCPYLIRYINRYDLFKIKNSPHSPLEEKVEYFCAYNSRKCEEGFCVNCEIYQNTQRRLDLIINSKTTIV